MSYQETPPTDTQMESRWESEAEERSNRMSDRHEKWQAVEPGHVIPAGQPYRIEWPDTRVRGGSQLLGSERVNDDHEMRAFPDLAWFVDSSWRPPLELPTKPTWGIVLSEGTPRIARWYRTADGTGLSTGSDCIGIESVLAFIECTPEQVARIEQQS